MALIASPYRPEPTTGFDNEKAVQVIAFFIQRAQSALEKLKLIKLVYLAERLSFERRGKPINFDDYYSLKDGPVASSALNGINGQWEAAPWHKLSLAEDNRRVSADPDIGTDHLSEADIEILDETWKRFGALSATQLRAWTHKYCPEYTEVVAGRLSIPTAEIMRAVGIPDADDAARDLLVLQRELGQLRVSRAA